MAGSIEKRGDSYRLVCVVGYNLQGRPIKKSKTVHCSKKEAKIELAKFVADVQNVCMPKENLSNLQILSKYGKEIMAQKNLHLQHIKDILAF